MFSVIVGIVTVADGGGAVVFAPAPLSPTICVKLVGLTCAPCSALLRPALSVNVSVPVAPVVPVYLMLNVQAPPLGSVDGQVVVPSQQRMLLTVNAEPEMAYGPSVSDACPT